MWLRFSTQVDEDLLQPLFPSNPSTRFFHWLITTASQKQVSMRLIAAALTLILFTWLMWSAGLEGYARSIAERGRETLQLDLTEKAVNLSPSDPETHYNRASLLWAYGDGEGAIKESERATQLRPRDYYLWFRLGFYHYHSDDEEGALAPFKEASRLAPYYAQPRWYVGNILLRMGQREEGCAELRRAAMSDITLLPAALNLAWTAYDGDARALERAFPPQTIEWRLVFARFFATHGRPAEALVQFRAAVKIPDQERRALLLDLLAARQFPEAYEVWSSSIETMNGARLSGLAKITDGGFENEIKFGEPGFGWQLTRDVQALRYSIDTVAPKTGAHCLRIDFNGDYNPASPVISQLVLVEPNAHYRLRFSARTQDVITGGLPLVIVTDASSDRELQIAQSDPLPKNTNGWQDYAVEFSTGTGTTGVQISLGRQACAEQPCPIFGNVWLDDFLLQKY